MKFNKDKCKLLHLERNNLLQWKLLGSTGQGSSSAEKDLGILVDRDLALAAKAASSMVDSMNRSTGPADRGVIVLLHSAFIRPHLQYCIQF